VCLHLHRQPCGVGISESGRGAHKLAQAMKKTYLTVVNICSFKLTTSILDVQHITMDTKTASYRPLMPSTSFSDEGYMPSKEEYSDPPAPTWRRCTIANPMLGALLSLITLTIIIIGLVLLRTPTDMQCTKQLNLYCKSSTHVPVDKHTHKPQLPLSKQSSTSTATLSTTSTSAASTAVLQSRSVKQPGIN
jgi:hypothetical protein